jgi:hypothetical protein
LDQLPLNEETRSESEQYSTYSDAPIRIHKYNIAVDEDDREDQETVEYNKSDDKEEDINDKEDPTDKYNYKSGDFMKRFNFDYDLLNGPSFEDISSTYSGNLFLCFSCFSIFQLGFF